MTRKRMIIAAAAVFMLVLTVFIIHQCTVENSKARYTASLYYYNEAETTIEGESTEIRYTDRQNLAEEIVHMLINGPKQKNHHRVISAGTKLLMLDGLEEGEVLVNFSPEFMTGNSRNDIMAVYSVVRSLCSVEGIYSVKVVVDGRDIYSDDGSIIGYLAEQDINLSTDVYNSEMREVKLYFPKENEPLLGAEVRSIRVTDQQPLAQYIINELIKGPRGGGLTSALDSGTELHSVEISNRICFVNFQTNFLNKNTGTAEHEKLAVFSIVNSLTELDYIERVQFFIDGKRIDKFGNINIFGMFGRDEGLISG